MVCRLQDFQVGATVPFALLQNDDGICWLNAAVGLVLSIPSVHKYGLRDDWDQTWRGVQTRRERALNTLVSGSFERGRRRCGKFVCDVVLCGVCAGAECVYACSEWGAGLLRSLRVSGLRGGDASNDTMAGGQSWSLVDTLLESVLTVMPQNDVGIQTRAVSLFSRGRPCGTMGPSFAVRLLWSEF